MSYLTGRKFARVVLGIAASSMIGTVAVASPGSTGDKAILVENLVTANNDETGHVNSDRVKFQTKGRTDVRVQKLTFPPRSFSGWHHHPGLVIVAVKSGKVTLQQADCSSKDYGPGQLNGEVFVEGHDSAQQASSEDGAVVYVTYVAPSADPRVFRLEDPIQCAN